MNPFVYVSGERSLAYGLAVTILTAILAWQCDVLTNGALSLGYGHELLWKAFARLLIAWAAGAVLLYVSALLLSGSRIRGIDVFGMNLLARSLPFAAMVLLTAPSLAGGDAVAERFDGRADRSRPVVPGADRLSALVRMSRVVRGLDLPGLCAVGQPEGVEGCGELRRLHRGGGCGEPLSAGFAVGESAAGEVWQ